MAGPLQWKSPTVTRRFGPLGDFSADLSRFTIKSLTDLDKVIRKVSLDVLSSVIAGYPHGIGTPVDTGRARGGWQVENQVPGSPVTVDQVESGRLDKSGTETIREGAEVIAQADRNTRIVISNNVPYVQILEYGRDDGRPGSPQAPQGMVRVALRAFPYMVERARRENE